MKIFKNMIKEYLPTTLAVIAIIIVALLDNWLRSYQTIEAVTLENCDEMITPIVEQKWEK